MTRKPDIPPEAAPASPLRRQMDDLVSRVPRHAIRAVIDEIEHTAPADSPKAQALRDALVEHFNRLRPFKARRLFYSLFEPLLVDDPVLYRAREPIPGLVQRVDVGGLWAALARLAFPKLAMEVQNRLDEMTRDAILDQVMASPEAHVMRTIMAGEAATYLASLMRNRKAAEEFLAIANREAMKDARQRAPLLSFKAPIDLRQLAFLLTILEDTDRLLPLLGRMRGSLSDTPAAGEAREAEVDGQVAMLVGYTREVRTLCAARRPADPVCWLPVLMALNVMRRYDVVLRYLREQAGPAAEEEHPLHEALFGHFSACCVTMVDVVRGAFGDVVVRAGHVLALSRPVRATLEEALTRFDRSLNAIAAGGLMANRSVGPRVRPLLAGVTQTLTGTVIPIAAERAQAAAIARDRATPDDGDVIWLLDFVWMWGATLGAVGYASPEIQGLKARIVELCHTAYLQAVKIERDEDTDSRMAHLVRINRILGAVGENLSPWLSAVSQGLQWIVRDHIDRGEEPPPEARFIIDRFAMALRRELGRTRNWQSADLVGLLRDYEARTW